MQPQLTYHPVLDLKKSCTVFPSDLDADLSEIFQPHNYYLTVFTTTRRISYMVMLLILFLFDLVGDNSYFTSSFTSPTTTDKCGPE